MAELSLGIYLVISVLHGFGISPFIHFIHSIPKLLPHATYFLGTEDVVLTKINKVPVLMKRIFQ